MMSTSDLPLPSEESLPSGEEGSISCDAFRNSSLDAGNSMDTPGIIINNSRNSSKTALEISANEFREVTAATLHEYFWPPNSVTDRYFIQEQLVVFLDAKSFKRKYPDLVRRAIVGADEKDYLLENGGVTQTQLKMGLNALRAEDVYDLMMNDYTDKFEEYRNVIADRNKEALAVKELELQAVKSDSKRLEEWRKKAVQSASEWNSELNRDRTRERRYFFDMQTMVIQAPCRKRGLPPSSDICPYPAALIPGQYQEFYKRYTTDELYKLPVNGVLQVDDYLPVKRSHSPEAITVKPEEILQAESEENTRQKEADVASCSKARSVASSVERLSADTDEAGICAFCQENIVHNDRFVQCSKCGSCGHPMCMDMADEMYNVVKGYNWMCMECKPCSICSKLDEEDKMLFCDRCDRGYHTFCVGLSELPSGRWVCTEFCSRRSRMTSLDPNATMKMDKAAEAAVAAVIATPSSLKPKKVKSLDRTVEAVAQAILAAGSNDSVADMSPASNSSLSNSPKYQPEAQHSTRRRQSVGQAPCSKCGTMTSKGRRRIVLCPSCLQVPAKMEQKPIPIQGIAESDTEQQL